MVKANPQTPQKCLSVGEKITEASLFGKFGSVWSTTDQAYFES